MILKEEKRNLFEVDNKYALAHCISEDCAMGAGIAVDFQRIFKMRNILLRCNDGTGTCCTYATYNRVIFNLITKDKYWQRPSYGNFTNSVKAMREECIRLDIKFLAMPKIGCGLDRLQWGRVKEILKETFYDMDIEILVCHL